MEHFEKPLMVEFHEGYEDVYVWKGLPGGFSRKDLYFFIILNLAVMIYQFVQGARSFTNYIGTFFVLLLLSGFYKGFKVGIDSIGFIKYESPYITRLGNGFLIWGKDPPVEITQRMWISIRRRTEFEQGVVYLYDKNERHIAFVGNENHYLDEFAVILNRKYNLKIKEDVEK